MLKAVAQTECLGQALDVGRNALGVRKRIGIAGVDDVREPAQRLLRLGCEPDGRAVCSIDRDEERGEQRDEAGGSSTQPGEDDPE